MIDLDIAFLDGPHWLLSPEAKAERRRAAHERIRAQWRAKRIAEQRAARQAAMAAKAIKATP